MALGFLKFLKGVGSAIGSDVVDLGFNQIGKSISADREQRYNERNMALQHEYRKKIIDYVNDYNLPTKSVARWRAAGIAPQAVFGNSPGGAGVASDASAPSSDNPGTDSNFSRFTQTLAELQQMRNDKKVADATVNKLNAEADKLRGDTKDPDITKRLQLLDVDNAQLDKEVKTVQHDILSIQKSYEDAKNQADLSIKQQILFETIAKIDKLLADKDVSEAMRSKLEADKKLIEEQINTEKSKQGNLDADTRLKNSQRKTEDLLRMSKKALTDQQARKVVAELKHQKIISNTDAYELAKLLAGLHDPRNLWDGIWRILNLPANALGRKDEFATALYQALYEEINE